MMKSVKIIFYALKKILYPNILSKISLCDEKMQHIL